MSTITEEAAAAVGKPAKGPLVYRQALLTRVTHWVWVIALFFMLLSGLQIFNAHPALYIGNESGFEYNNAILRIYPAQVGNEVRGYVEVFGNRFDTTGVFGVSGTEARPQYRAFPAALTIPSYQDLATGRVVHFFFGWVLVAALFVWFAASFINGHLRRDVIPRRADLQRLPQDLADHARLRLHHGRGYNAPQKLAYAAVFFGLFPLIILTGLTMSPGIDSAFPFLLDVFGGRQTARTIHFIVMALLVLFFVVHIVMVVLAGPLNELRSMLTGWYRTSPGTPRQQGDR